MKSNRWQPLDLTLLLALVLTACLLLIVGCGSSAKNADPTLRDFTMNFTGFTPHIGDTFYLRVTDTTTATKTVVGTATPTVLTSANFTVTLAKIIQDGHTYQIDFWADVDGNGTLDHTPNGTPAGVDHSWRKTGIGTATGLSVSFVHDTNWTDITPW